MNKKQKLLFSMLGLLLISNTALAATDLGIGSNITTVATNAPTPHNRSNTRKENPLFNLGSLFYFLRLFTSLGSCIFYMYFI